MPAGILQQPAPAAADIQQGHARFQVEFAADQLQLGFLGLCQGLGVAPVTTAVTHGGVEHGLEQVVAQIVMLAGHLGGTMQVLPVE